MDHNCFGNKKGFTLVEIIAVLVILGILAAVAVPKYMDMAAEARNKAACAAIDEIRSRLASVQNKYLMNYNGMPPTSIQLYQYATGPDGYNDATGIANIGEDFSATVTSGTPILITVTAVKGVSISPGITNTFKAFGDN
jgi:MSHA pilin protein MshA